MTLFVIAENLVQHGNFLSSVELFLGVGHLLRITFPVFEERSGYGRGLRVFFSVFVLISGGVLRSGIWGAENLVCLDCYLGFVIIVLFMGGVFIDLVIGKFCNYERGRLGLVYLSTFSLS